MKSDGLKGFRIFISSIIVTVLLASSGCVGYQLGSMLPPDIETVYVPTIINNTDEPLLEVEATRAVIQQIQRDGSLRIANEEEADTVLRVTLTDFRLNPVAFDRERRAAANEYRMIITADILMTRRGTDEVIVDYPGVWGRADFVLVGDLTTSKQTVIPRASEDLAGQIVDRMVETW